MSIFCRCGGCGQVTGRKCPGPSAIRDAYAHVDPPVAIGRVFPDLPPAEEPTFFKVPPGPIFHRDELKSDGPKSDPDAWTVAINNYQEKYAVPTIPTSERPSDTQISPPPGPKFASGAKSKRHLNAIEMDCKRDANHDSRANWRWYDYRVLCADMSDPMNAGDVCAPRLDLVVHRGRVHAHSSEKAMERVRGAAVADGVPRPFEVVVERRFLIQDETVQKTVDVSVP